LCSTVGDWSAILCGSTTPLNPSDEANCRGGHSVIEQELAGRGVMSMLGRDRDDLAIGLQQSAAEARCGVQKSCSDE
jgi:hypothetical protein